VFGAKSSGRSALALQCLATAQKQGLSTAIIDAAATFEVEQAERFGIDSDKLWYTQQDMLEETLDAVRVAANECQVVVLDDLASRASSKDTLDQCFGLRRLVSDRLRSLASHLQDTGASVVIVNQVRAVIGAANELKRSYFGDLVCLYAKKRIQLIEGPPAKDRHVKVGVYLYGKVLKSRGTAPHQRTMMRVDQDGFDYWGDILDLALQKGFVQRRGAYLFFGDANIGDSYKRVREYLSANPFMADLLENTILTEFKLEKV
jgi:recombination protein RecA